MTTNKIITLEEFWDKYDDALWADYHESGCNYDTPWEDYLENMYDKFLENPKYFLTYYG